jgi:hypothetical protein
VKVTLRVTDDKGAIGQITKTITVEKEIAFATRTLSTTHAAPGTTFRVTVTISVRTSMSGLGLDEDLPANWEVTPIDSAGATFKAATTQWIFPRSCAAARPAASSTTSPSPRPIS